MGSLSSQPFSFLLYVFVVVAREILLLDRNSYQISSFLKFRFIKFDTRQSEVQIFKLSNSVILRIK